MEEACFLPGCLRPPAAGVAVVRLPLWLFAPPAAALHDRALLLWWFVALPPGCHPGRARRCLRANGAIAVIPMTTLVFPIA